MKIVGFFLLLVGLALLFFNKPIAEGQKAVDELFGMGLSR